MEAGMYQVTYSILSADALKAEVAQAYGIDMPVSCQLLRRGLHDTYLLTTEDSRYIARVYRVRWRTPSDVAYELELLAHLATQGVSVAVPIPTRGGCLSRQLAAPEGTRQLVLFPYIEGTPLSWNEEEHCYLAGKLLASIHTASEDFASRHARFRLDLRYLIDAPLAAIRPFLAHRPEDWSYLEWLAGRLRARAAAAVGAGLDWGVCHGDWSSARIHISDGPTCTALDFDHCGPGWRAYDLAAIQWVGMGDDTGRIWASFMKGYTETRPLAAAELAALPLFHATCHLAMLGSYAENVDDWGALRLGDPLFDWELTFFREWEAKHLREEPRATLRTAGATEIVTPTDWKQAESTRLETNHLSGASAVPEQPNVRSAPGAGLFPVTHSILATDALQAAVAQAYPIDTLVTCRLLKQGLNDTYLLTTRNDRYITRVYGARWRTPSDIAYELELLTHLAGKGISVAVPIAARNGALSCLLQTPEGPRRLALFTYAAGMPLSWREEEHSYLAGQMAAAIHATSDDFASRHVRCCLNLEYLIDTPLARSRPFLAHRPADWNYLQGFAARLRTRATAAVNTGLDWGPCHGDFGAKNMHLAADGTVTVLDFDFCGPGWRVHDFTSVYRAALEQRRSAIWDAFLKGYTATRPIAAADLAAVPLFLALRRLAMLGVFAENVAEWGVLTISARSLDGWMAFFREWEAKHLEGS
jgi:Ser/Thr protein kinase RdoA (MazF antagonist)